MITIMGVKYTLAELQALIESINRDAANGSLNTAQLLFLEYVDAAISFNPRNHDQEFPFVYVIDVPDTTIATKLIIERNELEALGYIFRNEKEYQFIKRRLWLKQYFIMLVFGLGLNIGLTSDHAHFHSSSRTYDFNRPYEFDNAVFDNRTILVQQHYWLLDKITPATSKSMTIHQYAKMRLEMQYIMNDMPSAIILSNFGFLSAFQSLEQAAIGARAMMSTNAFNVFVRTIVGIKNVVHIFITLLRVTAMHNLKEETCRLVNAAPIELVKNHAVELGEEIMKKFLICDPTSDSSKYIMANHPELVTSALKELKRLNTPESNERRDLIFSVANSVNPTEFPLTSTLPQPPNDEAYMRERQRLDVPPSNSSRYQPRTQLPINEEPRPVASAHSSLRGTSYKPPTTEEVQRPVASTNSGSSRVPLSFLRPSTFVLKGMNAASGLVSRESIEELRILSKLTQASTNNGVPTLEQQVDDAAEETRKREERAAAAEARRLEVEEARKRKAEEARVAAEEARKHAETRKREMEEREKARAEQNRIRENLRIIQSLRDRPTNLSASATAAWEEYKVEQLRKEEEDKKRKEEEDKKREEYGEELRRKDMEERFGRYNR